MTLFSLDQPMRYAIRPSEEAAVEADWIRVFSIYSAARGANPASEEDNNEQ